MADRISNLGKAYKPLEVDFSVPRKCEQNTIYGRLFRFLLRAQGRMHLLIFRDLTYERQINAQLRTRKRFPTCEWQRRFTNVTGIERVLKEVARVSPRVNHHYTPSDRLRYVLWDDCYEDMSTVMSYSIRDYLGFKCLPEDIVAMARHDCTLVDFFEGVASQSMASEDQLKKL